ncbi:MAG: MraY family glycosyltransferase [Parvibaculales bacterium]
MINTLLALMAAAAILTSGLILLLFGYAENWGLTDSADSARKKHEGQIPLIGGISIFICLQIFELIHPSHSLALAVSLFILVVAGAIDDRFNMRALFKLLLQFLAVCVLVFGAGIEIVSLGTLPNGSELLLGNFSIPLTLVCAVAMINAWNMIDGIDGLAACLGILALIYLYFFSVVVGQPIEKPILITMTVLVGALLGFLIFNLGVLPGRKVFLGDAGSMLIGLFLAYLLIATSQRTPLISALPASIMPWVASVPMIDMAAVSIRRMLKGRSPMRADRTHLHHRLMDIGYSARETLVLMLILSLVFFVFGTFLNSFGGVHAGIGFVGLLVFYFIFVDRLFKTNAEV